jgi:hypothetical protein
MAGVADSTITLLGHLEDNEAALQTLLPAYHALLKGRTAARSSAASAGAAGSSPLGPLAALPAARPAPAPMARAVDLLRETDIGADPAGRSRATFLEMFRDASLFRVPLLVKPWDAGGEGAAVVAPLIARLPDYGEDAAHNNTLVLLGELYSLADERAWAGVSIGAVPPGGGPEGALRALERDVALHVSFRIDPRGGGGGGAAPVLKQRFLQTRKVRGAWENTGAVKRDLWGPGEWPFPPKKQFYLRLVLTPQGMFSYVDGKAIAFTRHEGGGAWAPPPGAELHVLVPVAGDASEKGTWRVVEAFWGHSRVDAGGLALMTRALEAGGAKGGEARREVLPDTLYVTGLRGDTQAADLREAFARWGVVEARVEGQGNAMVRVELGATGKSIEAVVMETDRSVVVLGHTVQVRQAHRTVRPGEGGAGAGSAGGGGGAGSGGLI